MNIQSTRLGALEVQEEQIIHFTHGLPGFPEEKEFALILHEPESPFVFLQSTTEEHLTFLLADPFVFFSDYEFELEDEIAAELEFSPDTPPQVLLIATVKERLADMTVNRLAPVVINLAARLGRQVILERTDYAVRHKLFPDGLPAEESKGGEPHVGTHP
jgi:flagellar assembly factor FliW